MGAQAGREFAVIHGDDDPAAGLSDNFLPQQSAASALDHIQFRVYLVGAVYGEVNSAGHLLSHHGNAKLASFLPGGLGSGKAQNVAQSALADEFGEPAGGKNSRGTGAQPHYHSRFYQGDSLFGSLFLIGEALLRRGRFRFAHPTHLLHPGSGGNNCYLDSLILEEDLRLFVAPGLSVSTVTGPLPVVLLVSTETTSMPPSGLLDWMVTVCCFTPSSPELERSTTRWLGRRGASGSAWPRWSTVLVVTCWPPALVRVTVVTWRSRCICPSG